MIFNSKYGYIYIFSKNNAFVLNDNNYNLNIFIKKLNKYVDITSIIFINKSDIFNIVLDIDENTTNLIYKNYNLHINNNILLNNNNNDIELLFNNNIKLINFCIKKYFNRFTSYYDDIYQEGSMALWQACNNFDKNKNISFSTYATSYIIGYIKKYLFYNHSLIKIPRNIYYSQNRENNNDFINCSQISSLNYQINDDNKHYMEEIIDNKQNEYDALIMNIDLQNIILSLKDIEQKIFKYHILGYSTVNISKMLNISQPNVSRKLIQIKNLISKKLGLF